MLRLPALLLAASCLSACGMKGSLELPPGPPPEPLLGHPRPAAKPAATPKGEAGTKDVSTDRNAAPQ